MRYFPIVNFRNFLLELLFALDFIIELTIMLLRQSVWVAVKISALAFHSQQPNLFIAIEASLLIFLLLLRRLQTQLLYFLTQKLFSGAYRGRCLGWRFYLNFFLFHYIFFSGINKEILVTRRTETWETLGAIKQVAVTTEGLLFFGLSVLLNTH